MSQSPQNPVGGLPQLLISIVVVPVLVLDAILRPLYGPLLRAIVRLRLLAAILAQVTRLPPYGILFVLAVPFVIAEPMKLVALYWMGTGHLIMGSATLVLAYGMSFILVERIYDAGREKLMRILGLCRLMSWVTDHRDAFLVWLRATRVWQQAQSVQAFARDGLRRVCRVAKLGS